MDSLVSEKYQQIFCCFCNNLLAFKLNFSRVIICIWNFFCVSRGFIYLLLLKFYSKMRRNTFGGKEKEHFKNIIYEYIIPTYIFLHICYGLSILFLHKNPQKYFLNSLTFIPKIYINQNKITTLKKTKIYIFFMKHKLIEILQ